MARHERSRRTEAAVLSDLRGTELSAKGRFKLLGELLPVATESSIPVLKAMLDEDDDRLVVRGLRILARLGTDSAVAAMLGCLETGDSVAVGWTAHFFARMRLKRVAPALTACLVRRDAMLGPGRARLIYSWIELGDPAPLHDPTVRRSVTNVLEGLLQADDGSTRAAAAQGLVALNGADAREALEDAAQSLSRWRSRPIRRALDYLAAQR